MAPRLVLRAPNRVGLWQVSGVGPSQNCADSPAPASGSKVCQAAPNEVQRLQRAPEAMQRLQRRQGGASNRAASKSASKMRLSMARGVAIGASQGSPRVRSSGMPAMSVPPAARPRALSAIRAPASACGARNPVVQAASVPRAAEDSGGAGAERVQDATPGAALGTHDAGAAGRKQPSAAEAREHAHGHGGAVGQQADPWVRQAVQEAGSPATEATVSSGSICASLSACALRLASADDAPPTLEEGGGGGGGECPPTSRSSDGGGGQAAAGSHAGSLAGDEACVVPPAPYSLGCRVQVLYKNGVWYSGTLTGSSLRQKHAGGGGGAATGSRFRVLFDDGDALWCPVLVPHPLPYSTPPLTPIT